MSKEVWKDIKGYEGFYTVSSLGRIKSLEREEEYVRKDTNKTCRRTRKERILIAKENDYGYYEVNLWRDGKNKYFRVHRLVADAFVSNPDNKPCVNHIDGNKKNNSFDNLEWATVAENTWHATHVLGTNDPSIGANASKKHTTILDTNTGDIYEFESRSACEKHYGADFQNIVGKKQYKKFSHLKLINEED